MSVLDIAKDWAVNNLVDDDTLAILLVGSWASGEGTDPNDIDLIIIKEYQLVGIFHQEHHKDDFSLDIWVHDKDAMHAELFDPAQDLNGINNISMIITALSDAVIWYEKEIFLAEYIDKAKNWTWDEGYVKFLEIESDEPISSWAKTAYHENLQLLDAAKIRLNEGKPVAHRRKDYPELIEEKTEEIAREVMDLTIKAYEALGIERHWSEFADAKKALTTGMWGHAVVLLKDVLRYIVRYSLPAVPDQLLDPRIWAKTDTMSLSDDIKKALEKIYS